MSNPTYDINDIGCGTTSDETIAVIQEKITTDGNLRNGKQVKAGGQTFVERGAAPAHRRSRTTRATSSRGSPTTWPGAQFLSVDVNARDDSSWPDADITVTAPGARESRACAASSSGKTKAQIQCELDQASGDIPADRKCDEL